MLWVAGRSGLGASLKEQYVKGKQQACGVVVLNEIDILNGTIIAVEQNAATLNRTAKPATIALVVLAVGFLPAHASVALSVLLTSEAHTRQMRYIASAITLRPTTTAERLPASVQPLPFNQTHSPPTATWLAAAAATAAITTANDPLSLFSVVAVEIAWHSWVPSPKDLRCSIRERVAIVLARLMFASCAL